MQNNSDDFNIVFACVATGVISGFGFSLMLKRFGASGGTYGISALIKKAHPEMNIAYVSFIMDTSVVFIAFFVYGMKITPTICTLINLFIANLIVDYDSLDETNKVVADALIESGNAHIFENKYADEIIPNISCCFSILCVNIPTIFNV